MSPIKVITFSIFWEFSFNLKIFSLAVWLLIFIWCEVSFRLFTIKNPLLIISSVFVANSGGYVQFADGSRQFTANSGSGTTGANSFGVIYTANNNTYANAATANAQLNFVGESGVVAYANSITKTITIAGTPGAQGLTVDYGFVSEAIFYSVDYGTL